MLLLASDSLEVLELVENELQKTFSEIIQQYCFFASHFSRLKVNVLEPKN